MENMNIWDALRTPPPKALSTITGGRLHGKTDISPQWRYKAMTEQFGPCGIGWTYAIEKLWLEPVGDEVCAFAKVNLVIKVADEWSVPIPGVGGSMLLAKESGGLHVSDEAFKMAITDALSVAMKMIGVAADVYAGLFDGSKYNSGDQKRDEKQSVRKQPEKSPPGRKTEPPKEVPPKLNNRGELYTRASKFGISPSDVNGAVGVERGEDIIDLDEAWIATTKDFAGTIKAVLETEENKGASNG